MPLRVLAWRILPHRTDVARLSAAAGAAPRPDHEHAPRGPEREPALTSMGETAATETRLGVRKFGTKYPRTSLMLILIGEDVDALGGLSAKCSYWMSARSLVPAFQIGSASVFARCRDTSGTWVR